MRLSILVKIMKRKLNKYKHNGFGPFAEGLLSQHMKKIIIANNEQSGHIVIARINIRKNKESYVRKSFTKAT